MWRTISSKEIFNHPRIVLVEDEVELPNGKVTKYLRYKDSGAGVVTIVCRRDDGKILLQKEYSYPINQKLFQFPGGGTHPGEKLEDGANRELMEEANLRANKLELIGKYLKNNRRSKVMFHVYLATDLVSDSLPSDETEEIESFWFSEDEIDDMIRNGDIINNHALSAWILYKIKIKK